MEHREIESQGWEKNVGEVERIISIAGGLGLLGAVLTHPTKKKSLFSFVGAYLLFRGISGHDLFYRMMNINRSSYGSGIRVERSITIEQPINVLYQFWRNFENLPRFMKHLISVTRLDDRTTHWVARAPLGMKVEWDAELVSEQDNQWISWRSLPGSKIVNTGIVRFQQAPVGRGTEVFVHLEYQPPGGASGAFVAKMFGEEPDLQIREDLRRFKQIMETGEIPTVEGQPSGQMDLIGQIT